MVIKLKKKDKKTLDRIKNIRLLGTIPWRDIEKLFLSLSAEIEEREGSRVAVILNNLVYVFHRPHPEKETNQRAVAKVKEVITQHFPTLMK